MSLANSFFGGKGLAQDFAGIPPTAPGSSTPNIFGVQNTTELTAFLAPIADKSGAFVEDEEVWYFFDAQSVIAPSGSNNLPPDNVTPPDPGRWYVSPAGPPPAHTHDFADLYYTPLLKSANYTLGGSDRFVIATAAGITLKLPTSGRKWATLVKGVSGAAVVVDGNGKNINGSATHNLTGRSSVTVVYSGTEWVID